jgi:hypothetical protein
MDDSCRPRPALVSEPGRAIREQPRRLDLSRQVGQLPLDSLERRDRLAELPARLRVSQGRFVGALREPHSEGRDADTARVEDLPRVVEPLAFLAEQVLGRHAAVLKHHLARVARAHPELVFLLPGRHAGRSARTMVDAAVSH